ncbi:hypothetical protein FF125_18170 [Aureibaculum algae]|uniref:Tetracycline regulation of excision, RteC n=1 Tax=Aureibaculum algae TaxID=2584122 RepID=A0A5B7TTW5_9FLAO|nr:RteC domain-containing protein [Aureibaculum algae]QCX40279.1 hypothetical protein FF125_18170 [Aureibaculum algae]
MNNILIATSFPNDQEEIQFFKKVKVQPISILIYFSEIRSFEIHFPRLSVGKQRKYLEKKIADVNSFFDHYIEFVQYVKDEKTHLDYLYYTRAHKETSIIFSSGFYYCPPEFCTSRDMLQGKVIAFNKLVSYLKKRLMYLKSQGKMDTNFSKSTFQWTSSKVALTELIYALHSSGAINSGNVDIKDIANWTENLFDVELGDYYRTYLAIRSRKVNRTKFLDNLKNSLLEQMDKKDE